MYSTCQCDTIFVQRVILWKDNSDVSIFANKLFVFVSELIALEIKFLSIALNVFQDSSRLALLETKVGQSYSRLCELHLLGNKELKR